jgi:hypothetical protein
MILHNTLPNIHLQSVAWLDCALQLRSHHLAELLEGLHELLVAAVLGHGFLGVGFEHIDSFHVLWVGEQFAYFLIGGDLVEKIVGHPL